ncbi:PDR/VanB family oxidoreductase [Herbiconiux sp.]|uniref:PDR/VanB family oxidoreductase n=1 Tax=Herbiconiux sp. TaxID=1871186 RepID=UPI0025BF446B|nr:PDR/VanB family oxidoreductase [Herbiconiux sp.]
MPETVRAIVHRRRMLTSRVCRLEFVRADATPFAPVPPGAHVTVQTPDGHSRSYSVTDVTAEGALAISVLREPSGRGGSISLVDGLTEGDEVRLGAPVDAFPLAPADDYLLIAGGIGITAIRSHYRHLMATGHTSVRVLYLVRTRREAAYVEEFRADPRVTVHESAASGRFDLWPLFETPSDQTHVYCCAGEALTEQVRRLTMHWRPSSIHFESFLGVDAVGALAAPFEAVWQPSGRRVAVDAGTSLLRALRGAGIPVASSCESGTCGTCVLALIAGEAEHRDLVLDPGERESRIISCTSRAVGSEIVVGPLTR